MTMLLTIESLGSQLGRVVSEMEVIIAKNDIAGLPAGSIAKVLGVTKDEIETFQLTQEYKDVRLLLGAEAAKLNTSKDSDWDAIEAFALGKLRERVPHERDTDTLLKIAAVANKAERRTQNQTNNLLDPSSASVRVPLQLSRRIIERIMTDGTREREETQQISLMNGTAVNPSFAEIDKALGVSIKSKPILDRGPGRMSDDFDIDDLVYKG